MPRRPLLAVLLAAGGALAAAGLVAAPPAAAAVTVAKIPLQFTLQVAPESNGATSCTVVAYLYRPSDATAAHPEPAILTTNGFGGSRDDQDGIGKQFGQRGYVTLSYSGLGFGGSGCKITLDDRAHDGAVASQLLRFLGGDPAIQATRQDTGQPYHVDFVTLDHKGIPYDPRVGMVGGSYGGQIQFAAAAVDPRLDTIVPIITWNDLAYSLAPNNTDFAHGVSYRTPGTEKYQWTSLFFGVGVVDGVQYATVDPARDVGCPNFDDYACVAKAQLDALGYPTQQTIDYARNASVASYLDKIRIPTLLLQGQADTLFNLQEAVATYRGLQAQGTPVKMIWQSWGHSNGTPAPGELDLSGDPAATYEGRRVLGWFDHYLKGLPVDTGPAFAYFRDYVPYTGIATPAYACAAAYPIPGELAAKLYLSGSNALVPSRSQVQPGSTSYANPAGGGPTSYSETSGVQNRSPFSSIPPSDTPGTFARWDSAPLPTNVDVVGIPRLDVKVSAPTVAATQASGPAGQLLFFAKIYDVAPDGSVRLVHRLISPTRVADVTKTVHVQLPGIVHRFAAGHKIAVVMAATDAAYRNNAVPQAVTITNAAGAPAGVLTLPIPRSEPTCPTPAIGGTPPAGAGGTGGGDGTTTGTPGDDAPTIHHPAGRHE